MAETASSISIAPLAILLFAFIDLLGGWVQSEAFWEMDTVSWFWSSARSAIASAISTAANIIGDLQVGIFLEAGNARWTLVFEDANTAAGWAW